MDNPYAASTADPALQTQGAVTPGMIEALRGTKPWVRFCAILGFIFTGLIFLGALGMGVGGGLMTATMSDSGTSAMPFAGFTTVIALVYVVIGVLYLFPSIKLWKYGSRITDLLSSQSTQDMEAALDAQRSFWKLVGIMLAAFIGLYVVGIAIAIVVSVIGTTSTVSF